MNTDYSKIELLVLDVDGVLTDGKIILTPAGDEIKEFHVRDGAAMKWWQRLGLKIAMITGRGSPAVEVRAKGLGVNTYRLMAKDKLPAFESVLGELGLKAENAAVMGDDLPDLPLLLRAGLPVAVADAVAEVKAAGKYVTQLPGGAGCVREVIELILRGRGQWQSVVDRYTGRGS